MFEHYYNTELQKAVSIDKLIEEFEKNGNIDVKAATGENRIFTADEWKDMSDNEKDSVLMNYRIAYRKVGYVNWCEALGTVLANDEVKDGVSERGGHPVVKKPMNQWSLRITAYAERLLNDMEKIDWSDSLKTMQRNWIGRSEGLQMFFDLEDLDEKLEIYTTRPDTIFGVTFMVLSPEHPYVDKLTIPEYEKEIAEYKKYAVNRSEIERTSEKKVSGVFTGSYAINPLNGKKIPVWISEYVLMDYGTGAIMAVPAHDSRDFAFARHFDLPIIQVVTAEGEEPVDPKTWNESYDSKEGIMINSGFITKMQVKEAMKATIDYLEENTIGYGTVNFRLRDAIFSRQRYWGEPFPIYYKDGMPYPLDEDELPLKLPKVDKYLPTEKGEPPLARAENWKTKEGYPLETNTMPGFAGSSGYYLRYMDPGNKDEYFSKEANEYWRDVDLYLGGDEHATGHLIYARFWNMFLFDMGLVCEEEPFKKLINQGKIQGRSNFVYRIDGTNKFVSFNLRKEYKTARIHADVSFVDNDVLDIEAFRNWRPEFKDAEFILENGKYICGWEVEKMSKSKHNVVNPDELMEQYGADTFRLYEMFLGPLENHKPWDTNGIEGVYRFIKKLWRLFFDENGNWIVTDDIPNDQELKVLHQTIKKIRNDIERFSFNTAVSQFMICVNELTDLKCHKKQVLENLTILISSYAPHIAEELWNRLGHNTSVTYASFPEFREEYVKENTFEYPVSFNGKMRFKLELPVDMSKEEIKKRVMKEEKTKKYIGDKQVRKVIVVPKRIINIVIG
jgi:leucyl-tRNA synthetase